MFLGPPSVSSLQYLDCATLYNVLTSDPTSLEQPRRVRCRNYSRSKQKGSSLDERISALCPTEGAYDYGF